MAFIAPIVIGCIDYLAYGTIFTRAIFHPKIKLIVFYPPEKPYRRCLPHHLPAGIYGFSGGKKNHQICIPATDLKSSLPIDSMTPMMIGAMDAIHSRCGFR